MSGNDCQMVMVMSELMVIAVTLGKMTIIVKMIAMMIVSILIVTVLTVRHDHHYDDNLVEDHEDEP